MALHKEFPNSPYAILDPEVRWFPADEVLRKKGYEKLLPPLVDKLRREVAQWRSGGYNGTSETSHALLRWWFEPPHSREFRYYFAQREAVETIIYCYEVAGVKDKYDLIRYDSIDVLSPAMFPEDWLRMVIKMATGSGKTKVMSLLIAWSYFHKVYEENSQLSRNILLITPNIIVLDRIRSDLEGLKIFKNDPVVPDNGFEGRNWQDDFQMTIHMQDNIRITQKTGNIFLTNIHRVYNNKDTIPNAEDDDTTDYFLGERPVARTSDSKINLNDIVRNVDELIVFNDEAHHIHNKQLAWFKSIEDINNHMKMKGTSLSLQIDVTATPKHSDGSIFVQTISDYPLVEAIHQDVVKHPVLPDSASRAKLQEHKSLKFTEKYKEYIHLGYQEWKKAYKQHEEMGKKAVLFIMTDDTINCDDVAEYLKDNPAYPEFQSDRDVLVIHTKNNGEISEDTTSKREEELKGLRKAASEIDDWDSPHKAIVSVLMLKEGWDTRNVTTIVGLRAYVAKSNILPEQTLGRGLRRMYLDSNVTEYVSIVGTDAFMDFVESIKSEGVDLEKRSMGESVTSKPRLAIEVDNENTKKDIEELDIEIPILSPRIYREYKNISNLDVKSFTHEKIIIKEFSKEERRQIVFRDIASGEIMHKTELDSDSVPNYQSVIGYLAQLIKTELRLVGGYDILYGKVKEFVINHLFEEEVDLENSNILRNLSELEATKTIIETFKKEINEMTILDKGETEIQNYIKISKSRLFIVNNQNYIVPKKSVFNKIVGDSHFELQFADFLEKCDDIISYAKNYRSVNFKIDYKDADGNIKNYHPDFFVKVSDSEVYVVETKGREDLNDVEKIARLRQWCGDVNEVQKRGTFAILYVKQEDFEKYTPKNFSDLVRSTTIKG